MSVSSIDMANAIRFLTVDAIEKSKSGHPGMPLGAADIATVLFTKFLKFDAINPGWPDRDRFVLSAGHGSMLLYSLLYLTGYKEATIEGIQSFRQLGSKMAGHPEFEHLAGVEVTTGPLGQGIANAVGMALSERMLNSRFGDDLCSHYTYVLVGDGCLMEGISQEAISLAGRLNLNKLIVLWDDNNITIDGTVDLTDATDQKRRFEACGWNVISVDGHNHDKIEKAIAKARKSDKPTFIACKTIIAKGAPNKAGTSKVHGSPLGTEEVQAMRDSLGWTSPAFEIPEDILNAWREVGLKGLDLSAQWEKKLIAMDPEPRCFFMRTLIKQGLLYDWQEELQEFKEKMIAEKPTVATRKASQMVLDVVTPLIQELIGGSADLTSSNLTKTSEMKDVSADDFSGRYINYGIREHAMAAIMNGISLHGGFIPYGGTFFTFADYMKPSMRLAALMKQRVIYVLTHDSIGVGEDGPTHQPIEQLAMLRATPNTMVYRPCDIVETAECWELSLLNKYGPSVLALSRQNLPTLRTHASENLSSRGGYVISPVKGERDATIIATGSEVELAINAQKELASEGINVAVVSMPCWELFDKNTSDYKEKVLGDKPRLSIEALTVFGWEKYVGLNGYSIGMRDFGASGPAEDLFKHFKITVEEAVKQVKRLTGK